MLTRGFLCEVKLVLLIGHIPVMDNYNEPEGNEHFYGHPFPGHPSDPRLKPALPGTWLSCDEVRALGAHPLHWQRNLDREHAALILVNDVEPHLSDALGRVISDEEFFEQAISRAIDDVVSVIDESEWYMPDNPRHQEYVVRARESVLGGDDDPELDDLLQLACFMYWSEVFDEAIAALRAREKASGDFVDFVLAQLAEGQHMDGDYGVVRVKEWLFQQIPFMFALARQVVINGYGIVTREEYEQACALFRTDQE